MNRVKGSPRWPLHNVAPALEADMMSSFIYELVVMATLIVDIKTQIDLCRVSMME
jgi:hypothetical protein